MRIWDATSGAIVVLRGHENRVNSAAFSSESQRVISASDDGTKRVWAIPLRDQTLIDAARTKVPRQFSPTQRAEEFLDNTHSNVFVEDWP